MCDIDFLTHCAVFLLETSFIVRCLICVHFYFWGSGKASGSSTACPAFSVKIRNELPAFYILFIYLFVCRRSRAENEQKQFTRKTIRMLE